MLVLTRKLQQQIKIGDNVTLTVLRVKGNTVRIGIQAPRNVRVVRGELPAEQPVSETMDVEMGEAADGQPGDPDEGSSSAMTSGDPRLPQRRKFDRYGQPPLRLAGIAAAMAK